MKKESTDDILEDLQKEVLQLKGRSKDIITKKHCSDKKSICLHFKITHEHDKELWDFLSKIIDKETYIKDLIKKDIVKNSCTICPNCKFSVKCNNNMFICMFEGNMDKFSKSHTCHWKPIKFQWKE